MNCRSELGHCSENGHRLLHRNKQERNKFTNFPTLLVLEGPLWGSGLADKQRKTKVARKQKTRLTQNSGRRSDEGGRESHKSRLSRYSAAQSGFFSTRLLSKSRPKELPRRQQIQNHGDCEVRDDRPTYYFKMARFTILSVHGPATQT